MALTKAQAAAVDILVDYLSQTTPPGRNCPPRHCDAHNALVLLAVGARTYSRTDGHDADARLAAAWRDQLNVQADLARLAELEAERDETPLTEQLFMDFLSLPGLGSTRVTARFTDTNDGQVVTLTGIAIGMGVGPQIKATSRREARDRVRLEIALPLAAPDDAGNAATTETGV